MKRDTIKERTFLIMGDKDFEKFFNECHGDGNEEGTNDNQRLMLDAISVRAETLNNMYGATAEFLSTVGSSDLKTITPIDSKTIKSSEAFMVYLMEQAKITIQQSDYLISRILDGFEGNDDEGEGSKE